MPSPSVAPPAPEALAEFLATHDHRFPEKATIAVIGDGGAPIDLPLLIANPTGASPARAGIPTFPAWDNLLASTVGARDYAPGAVSADLVRDCLVFPGRGLLAQWEERWPAILEALGPIVMRKIGGSSAFLREPAPDAEKPAPIAEALAQNPAACWRIVTGGQKSVDVTVAPPDRRSWQAFKTQVAAEGADHKALFAEIVGVCVRGDGLGAELVARPGLLLPLEHLIVRLAGRTAEARMGGW